MCLKCLFARRVNSLSHNEKTILQPEAVGNAFGGQIPDALRSSGCRYPCLCTKAVMDLSDKFRSGAAASPQYGCADIHQYLHFFGKLFCFHVIAGSSVFIQKRQSGIWLCNDRYRSNGYHVGDDAFHLCRTGGTVRTDSARTQTFQYDCRRFGICAE